MRKEIVLQAMQSESIILRNIKPTFSTRNTPFWIPLEEAAPQAERNYLRGIAGVFLFSGDDQKKPIKALSGGERNRVALARMLVEPANTLCLDEPTNHLDPSSVDILTDALIDFPGTMVFISHDPTFLSRVATRVVEIDEGQARDYVGDYEYYLWKRAKELEAQLEKEESSPSLKAKKKRKSQDEAPTNGTPETPKPSRRELTKTVTRLEKQVIKIRGSHRATGISYEKPGHGTRGSGHVPRLWSLEYPAPRERGMGERIRRVDPPMGKPLQSARIPKSSARRTIHLIVVAPSHGASLSHNIWNSRLRNGGK